MRERRGDSRRRSRVHAWLEFLHSCHYHGLERFDGTSSKPTLIGIGIFLRDIES